MLLKPEIHYWEIEIYKKYRNYDPGMTLPYFTAGSNLDWTNFYKMFKRLNLQHMTKNRKKNICL